jgi:hypothetical protein
MIKFNLLELIRVVIEWCVHNRLVNANFDAKFKKKTPVTSDVAITKRKLRYDKIRSHYRNTWTMKNLCFLFNSTVSLSTCADNTPTDYTGR